jgi:hypothetical protein
MNLAYCKHLNITPPKEEIQDNQDKGGGGGVTECMRPEEMIS